MSTGSAPVRWRRLVTVAVAVALSACALMILSAAPGLLPRAIRDYPIEWSAAALLVALRRARAFVAGRAGDDPTAVRARRWLERIEAGSCRALDGGLAVAVGLLALALLASWVPNYLTWPWCRDEDTFATIAQSWDAGIRPYRDILGYNFPGHIYLHWLIGRVFGWGHPMIFYVLDASAVIGLGVALWAWSRRRLGGPLPGLVAYFAFLGYYLGLEYHLVAERDWHATLAAALAIMALEAWPGRRGLWVAAALEAAALTIRPHAILFLPAMVLAILQRPRPARALAEWTVLLPLLTALGFAPLAIQGILDDLIRGLRIAAYGGPYSRATLAGGLEVLRDELRQPWTPALIASLAWLGRSGGELRRSARTWLIALLAAMAYRALHPVQHGYLWAAPALIRSIAIGLPTAWIASSVRAFESDPEGGNPGEPGASAPCPVRDGTRRPGAGAPGSPPRIGLSRPVRVLAISLILYEAVPRIPMFCVPLESLRALGTLARGVYPPEAPLGCRHPWFRPHTSHYDWSDYCRVIEYLRRETGPETQIANVLRHPPFPPLNGPVGRLSPFHAESGICWMWLVDLDLDAPFAEALERTPDSVVVWSPKEIHTQPRLELERVTEVIRRHYRPAARFGAIEVWRRDDSPGTGETPPIRNRSTTEGLFRKDG